MDSGNSLVVSQPNELEKPAIRSLLADQIKVVVHDYHSLYLDAFTSILRQHHFNVIGKAIDETELISILINNGLPDIAIINYKTSNRKTLDVARRVKENYPTVKIIISTAFNYCIPVNEMKRIGIEGLLIKNNHDVADILRGLLTVYSGGLSYLML